MAGPHHYPIGAKPEITATFRTSAGVLTTPTTTVFMLKDPAGNETTVTSPNAAITTVSTGVVKYTHGSTVSTAGVWNVRAKGTAGLVAALDDSFIVDASPFTTP